MLINLSQEYTLSKNARPHTAKSCGRKQLIMYPRLVIDTKKIANNVKTVTSSCKKYGLNVVGITKGVCGDEKIAHIFAENGVCALGDSRIQNIKKYRNIPIKKWLIRPPQFSEVDEVVQFADISINSQLETLHALNKACVSSDIDSHGIILLQDLGDLRDGFVKECELVSAAREIEKLPHLYLAGLACNLTCLNFIKATPEKLNQLVATAAQLKNVINAENLIISGGNSGTLKIALKNKVPDGINNLRLGESLLIGKERDSYTYLPNTCKDTFILQAEIIELKEKPSLPWGEVNTDSFGKTPHFEDRGKQWRAILAIGNQDCCPGVMEPLDDKVRIVGDSCDHIVCELDCHDNYKVGDIIEFRCGYHAFLHAMTSEYVEKVYV